MMPGTAAATCEHEENQTEVKADTVYGQKEAGSTMASVSQGINNSGASYLRTFWLFELLVSRLHG